MIKVYDASEVPPQEMRSALHPSKNGPGYYNLIQGFRWDDGTFKVRGGCELYLAAPVADATLIDWWCGELNGTVYLVEAVLKSSKIRLYYSTNGSIFDEMTEVGGWSGGTTGDSRFSTNSGRVSFAAIKMPQGFVAGTTLPSRDVLLIVNGADHNRIWDPGQTASATLIISSVATSGGLIKITTNAAHNRYTGDTVVITGGLGAIAANLNGSWTITKVDADELTLDGSTFVSGYTANSATISDDRRLSIHQPVSVPSGARGASRAVHNFHKCWTTVGAAGTIKYGSSAAANLINQSRFRFRDANISPYASGTNVVPWLEATASAVAGDIAELWAPQGLTLGQFLNIVLEDQAAGSATFDDLIRNGKIDLGTGNFGAYATITGAADNGAGLIRITATAHGFSTGNTVTISGVVGTVEANGTWTITAIAANTFDLQGSAFAVAYVSGGFAVNDSVVFVNLYDPSSSDQNKRDPLKNQLADGIDNPAISPPEVSMWSFRTGHLTAAQLAATYYHLRVTRTGAVPPQDTTIGVLLNVCCSGSVPGGSEVTLSWEDAHGHSESYRLVCANDDAALLRDAGGPITLYDYKFPISSDILYDLDIILRNAEGAATIDGGLNGEPSRVNIYLRVPGETVALYWYSVKLYDPAYTVTARGWGKIASEETIHHQTSDVTDLYGFDWTARDSGRFAPSDYQIAIPPAFCCCWANGRLLVGNILDAASQNQRGEIYYSGFEHPFRFQAVVENEASGGRTIASGERIQNLFATAAAAQGRSNIFALTNRRLATLGGSGPFLGSSSDAAELSVLETICERGTNSPRSLCVARDGWIFWVDDSGQAVRFAGGVPVPISRRRFDDTIRAVPAARRDDISGVFFDDRPRWLYTQAGGTTNTRMVGFNDEMGRSEFDDLLSGTLFAEAERILVMYDSSGNGSGQTLLVAKANGAVYKFEVAGKGDDGTSNGTVATRLVTGDILPGDPLAPYVIEVVTIEADPQDTTFTIKRVGRSPDCEYQTQVAMVAASEIGWVSDETEDHTENDAPFDAEGERYKAGQLDISANMVTGTRLLQVACEVLDYSTREARSG